MNILQLGKFYPIKGGVEKVMYNLCSGISAKGISCDMLCTSYEGESVKKNISAYSRLEGTATWLKVAATTISPSMVIRLREICDKYDIIHIHHPDPMAAFALRLSGYKGKVILHWHSDIVKQKQLLRLYKPLQNWLIKRADLIIGTSPVYIKESPFLADVQGKMACLPIGANFEVDKVDTAGVQRVRARYQGKKIVFSMGRLVNYKGYEYLIDAAKYLTDDYVILIGGEGPLGDKLLQQIENEGLTDKVKLLGFLSDAERDLHFAASDIFCLSSIQKTEAFAIVQVEAMACGKPVVATRIPGSGVSWVNKDQISGLNVEPCNSRELADAIIKICGDAHEYERYSRSARERFEQLFTQEKMIETCINLYHSVLDGTGR